MKSQPIIFPFFVGEDLVHRIQTQCHFELGRMVLHEFPDEETVIRIDSNVSGRTVIFVTSLDKPNSKFLPLVFAAETAKSLGASQVLLVAPYLAYMRQDKIFEPGQGITSIYFAQLINHYFDGLVTLDPHLHRWHSLKDIYTIPTKLLHATESIAQWIHQNVPRAILIGPDEESAQWVEEVAKEAHAAFVVLIKNRKGDSDVEVSIPDVARYQDFVPVLIDDIISTGRTMIETINHLHRLHMSPPVCIGVHAVFAGDAYEQLTAARVAKIVTCNTIEHPSNAIDISGEIIAFLKTGPDFIWDKK